MRILLTHTAHAFRNYYGDEALAALSAHGDVLRHGGAAPLDAAGLVAFVRCAMDIRNIDVAAASRAGTLVTRASAGFVDAVAELALGFMVDLGRGVSAAAAAYRRGAVPAIAEGVQLSGATVGIIGYGAIGRRVADLARALRMAVLVTDPAARVEEPGITQATLADLLAASRFVICLAPARAETRT